MLPGPESVGAAVYFGRMQPPLEQELREYLVHNLDLIEPGLRPVQLEEYRLQNAHGTRGSIDILARDRHGLWVVIELKRSKTTSRQALHEVAKYTELLCREDHLAPDRIRAIIVSTDWSELLVPVSNMARDWNHDLRGYHLILDDNGLPATAQRVKLLARAFEHRITPIHIMYFFHSAQDRNDAWLTIIRTARKIGAVDMLAAEFDRVGHFDRVPNPFGLYVGIGRIDPNNAAARLRRGYSGPEPFAADNPVEYLALCHICDHLAGKFHKYRHITESAYPGLLSNIANDADWAVRGYCGSGAFDDVRALDERDRYRFLSGDDRGDGQIKFTGSANPAMTTRWKNFITETENSLAGNREWSTLVRGWLDEVATSVGDGDVVLHIYNPCDLLGTLIHGWPDRMDDYLPSIFGFTNPESGYASYVNGALYWTDGSRGDLAESFRRTYRDVMHWQVQGACGISWVSDQDLLGRLGLRYILLEQIGPEPPPSLANESRIWMLEDGAVRSYSATSDPDEYALVFDRISHRGELVSVGRYLAEQAPVVDVVVSQYRHGIEFM
jgi:hypothetical protein